MGLTGLARADRVRPAQKWELEGGRINRRGPAHTRLGRPTGAKHSPPSRRLSGPGPWSLSNPPPVQPPTGPQ